MDYALSSLELPASYLCNIRRDSRRRGWNYELQAARAHICCQMFRGFTGILLSLCSCIWRGLKSVLIERLDALVTFSTRTNRGPHKAVTVQSLVRYATSLINLREGSNGGNNPSFNTRWDEHESRTAKRPSSNTPIMSIRDRRGSSSSSSSPERSSPSWNRSSRQGSRKPDKKSQQVSAVHKQTPSQAVTKSMFRFYYGIAKYCDICLRLAHTIESCPLMLPRVRTVFKQHRENIMARRPVSRPHVPYGMRRQPYYGQERSNHYPVPLYQDRRASENKSAASNSTLKSSQKRHSQLKLI